jgi:hypothetical protein
VYSGDYGPNGFRLDFSDNSSVIALGTDSSGNGNNWTPIGFSITAGTGNDSLFDSPTNGTQTDTGAGGEVSGNYATFNPLNTSTYTFANGNLDSTGYAATNQMTSTIGVSSGKWYAEFVVSGSGGISNTMIGISRGEEAYYPGQLSTSYGYIAGTGQLYNNGLASGYASTYTYGDVIGVALDMDAGTLAYYKNGSSLGQAASGLSGTYFFACRGSSGAGDVVTANFGQRAFANISVPSGFKALCTANLTDPSIVNSSTVMGAVAYIGNGTSQTITLPGTGFDPDLIWIKKRSAAANHVLYDAVRGFGTSATKTLYSDLPNLEDTTSVIPSTTSTGFNLSGSGSETNQNTATYVSWCWDAGTTTGSNSDGSAVSQVRKNLSAGISIMTASPSGAAETMGHGLGLIPNLIISKRRDANSAWYVRTSFLTNPPQQYLILNSGAQLANDASAWANTAADASVITVNAPYLYGGACDLVHYCFVAVNGFSAFGTYDGNSSADGPFVHCGFRPRYLMVKAVNGVRDWMVWDSARVNYNVNNATLSPNTNLGDLGPGYQVDFLSNGFKLRASTQETNNSLYYYLYCAFAENPFKYTRAA